MSHEISHNKKTGRDEMAWVGETPWHGLGTNLPENASFEEWIAAALPYTVRRSKLMYYADRAGKDLRVDDESVALIRSDTGDRLGIVSSDYEVVQPYEMIEFFRDLSGEMGFKLETAGALFGGKRYWALAKIDEVKIAGWDKLVGYLMLSSSADGSRATEGRHCATRVVCNNTMSMALAETDKKVYRTNHRQSFKPDVMKARLGLAADNFSKYVETVNALTKIKVSDAAADAFILKLLRPSKNVIDAVNAQSPDDSFDSLLKRPVGQATVVGSMLDDEANVRRPRGADNILALFLGAGRGSELTGSAGTAWGLVNAVTEYVDHWSTSKSDDHRFDRAMFGTGDQLKTDAFSTALQLA